MTCANLRSIISLLRRTRPQPGRLPTDDGIADTAPITPVGGCVRPGRPADRARRQSGCPVFSRRPKAPCPELAGELQEELASCSSQVVLVPDPGVTRLPAFGKGNMIMHPRSGALRRGGRQSRPGVATRQPRNSCVCTAPRLTVSCVTRSYRLPKESRSGCGRPGPSPPGAPRRHMHEGGAAATGPAKSLQLPRGRDRNRSQTRGRRRWPTASRRRTPHPGTNGATPLRLSSGGGQFPGPARSRGAVCRRGIRPSLREGTRSTQGRSTRVQKRYRLVCRQKAELYALHKDRANASPK
jgi:hypothetical protein